jgi:hypothetical protein
MSGIVGRRGSAGTPSAKRKIEPHKEARSLDTQDPPAVANRGATSGRIPWLSLGKPGSELSSGRSRRSSRGFRSSRSGRSAFNRNDNATTSATAVAAAVAAVAAIATVAAVTVATIAAVATAMATATTAAAMATVVAAIARTCTATIAMAAVAAIARRMAAIAAATLATEEASVGLLLTAHEGDSNQREKDRDTKNDNTVHPRILQLLTGTSKREN